MKKRNRPAFTLIELLVVMAIISILASLLLPTLSKAKSKTQQTACLNKLKQWGIAVLLYKDDNDDFLPREKCVTTTHSWADISAVNNRDVWCNALPPAYFGAQGAYGYATDPDAFHSTRNIFQCPRAKLPSGDVPPIFSLAINSKLNSTTNLLAKLSFSSIEEPASTVLFLDSGTPGEDKLFPLQKAYEGQPSAWANRLSGRHSRGSNLVFIDGRGQWYAGAKIVDPSTGTGYPPPSEVHWTSP
jgi:prepilin-type N-terminal cleavage/methylation domain-containing protein/prepilin-type processing-associated H-X9-DG protein